MTPHIRDNVLMQTYDQALGCSVREISICPETGIGVLSTYGDGNPDMSACIERFEELDREIEEILVVNWFEDETLPNEVFRRADGDWQAFVYPYKRRQTR